MKESKQKQNPLEMTSFEQHYLQLSNDSKQEQQQPQFFNYIKKEASHFKAVNDNKSCHIKVNEENDNEQPIHYSESFIVGVPNNPQPEQYTANNVIQQINNDSIQPNISSFHFQDNNNVDLNIDNGEIIQNPVQEVANTNNNMIQQLNTSLPFQDSNISSIHYDNNGSNINNSIVNNNIEFQSIEDINESKCFYSKCCNIL